MKGRCHFIYTGFHTRYDYAKVGMRMFIDEQGYMTVIKLV